MKLRPVTSALYAVLFATAACSSSAELSDKRLPTGSQTLATSSDYSALYVTNTDHGTIGRVPLAGGAPIDQIQVGQRPTRVARGGNRVYVTLRGDRQVAVLEERGSSLAEIGRIDVGAEPFGVVASADGARVYVAVSLEDKVLEIDGGSMAILREWSVAGQPRWLALHPSGESLFVASAFTGLLTWVDLVGNQTSELAIPMPETFNGTGSQFARRMTGDLAISANGELLLSPGIVVDNTTQVPEDDKGEFRSPGGYDAGRFNPVVVAVNLEPNGQPIVETVALVSVTSFTTNMPVVGYPSSVAIDPESQIAVVTIEGGAAAVAMSIETAASEPGVFDNALGGADAIAPVPGRGGFGGFNSRPNAAFGVPAGPRGVVFADAGKPSIYSFIDHQVSQIDLALVRDRISPEDGEAVNFAGSGAAFPDAARVGPGEPGVVVQPVFEFRSHNELTIADEVLSPLEAEGRRLFFATNNSKMSAGGSGVSCATCHFDGRNDGLTWNFVRSGVEAKRQTPSLAGKISLQAPVRWQGDRVTVADDAMRTSQGLMGGQGMVEADAAALEAFIDSTPDVDAPLLADDAAVLRGKAIFESAEAACATCHNGPRYTDNKQHPMPAFDLPNAQTRALVGLAATAPYYHDGRSPTLRDVLEKNAELGDPMGKTSHLTDKEKDDLVAYLRSL